MTGESENPADEVSGERRKRLSDRDHQDAHHMIEYKILPGMAKRIQRGEAERTALLLEIQKLAERVAKLEGGNTVKLILPGPEHM